VTIASTRAAKVHTLRFVRRARDRGLSMAEIGGLLSLWRNQRRTSADVKRLALRHVAVLESKIEELRSMRDALAELAAISGPIARYSMTSADCQAPNELAGQEYEASSPARSPT
jgi:DNA-binding transcriptional MerR regulator